MKIIAFDLPQSLLFFEQQFRRYPAARVFRQTQKWKQLLKSDFILSEVQKKDLKSTVAIAEMLAWNALRDASFPQLGPWHLSCTLVPTISDGRRVYIWPDVELVAIHEKTKEKRIVVLPGKKPDGTSPVDAWRTGFQKLGLLDLVLKQPSQKHWVSGDGLRPWPIFTQVVIPRLYEFMLPYYPTRGHIWSEKEKTLKREAHYPKDLLEDMLDILRQEHPKAFGLTTTGQLKAIIQRYLKRKSTQTTKSA